MGCHGLRLAHNKEPIFARHADIRHNQRVHAATEFFHGFACTGGGVDPPSPAYEAGFEGGAHSAVIVHHKNTAHRTASSQTGKLSRIVVPRCGVLSARIVPLCCSTILRHTASPSPGLPARRLKPGSKMRDRQSAGIPGPVSATVSSILLPSADGPPPTSIHPPSGMTRMLFSTRFNKTCSRQ